MKKWLIASLLLFTPFMVNAEPFEEELHYFNVDPAQPSAEGNKIQVIEFFLYSCPHCFKLEPHVLAWLKTKPDYVEFVRIPAMFKRDYIIMYAKTFYALEQMGLIDDLHDDLFHVLQVEKRVIKTQAAMEVFLKTKGVNIPDFQKQMKSFGVHTKINRASILADKFGVTGVPAMTVDGKYRVAPLHRNKTIAVTDYLIKEVHDEKVKALK